MFRTQTDSEVDRASRARALARRGAAAICCAPSQLAVAEFQGAYAIAVISTREPGRVVGARHGQPAGRRASATDDHFLASDAAALLSVTQRVVYLEEGDVADVRRESYAIYDAQRRSASSARSSPCEASGAAVELGPVPPLHAEGDLRAAARGRRHARRRRRRSIASLFGAERRRGAAGRSTRC